MPAAECAGGDGSGTGLSSVGGHDRFPTPGALVIEEILPPTVVSAEAFDDPAEVTLFPEEEAVVARAVGKRRREFGTARHCARRALARLGLPPAPVLPGPRGAPRWPDGVVGSMTHCDGYRAAALAYARDVRAIGIDAEPHDALPEGVLEVISLAPERERLAGLRTAEPRLHWDRLLFSAKESVYKAWFPLTGRWLGFEDAEVSITPDGRFTVRLLVPASPPAPAGFAGRWVVRAGLILTAVTG